MTKQLAAFVLMLAPLCASAERPPRVRIEKNTCPGEFCVFRQWRARVDVELVDKVGGTKLVATAKAGEVVKGITGERHGYPTAVDVVFAHGKLKPGARVYLLYGDGEEGSLWGIWAQGKVIEEVDVGSAMIPLDLAAYADVTKVCRSPSKTCWGRIVEERAPVWWLKIQLANGRSGWVKDADGTAFAETSSAD